MQQVECTPWHNGLLLELLLTLPPEGDWEEIVSQAVGCLEAQRSQFAGKGALLTVDVANRMLDAASLSSLIDTAKHSFGLQTVALVGTDLTTQAAARSLLLTNYMLPPGSKVDSAHRVVGGGNALYVPGTVRSGQRVVHSGHITIGGDVNAGAEVIAVGDVVVFGALRGLAHAGCQGDTEARIIAGRLCPPQLRIAGCIAQAPENNEKDARRPEVARIEHGNIQVFPV